MGARTGKKKGLLYTIKKKRLEGVGSQGNVHVVIASE